MGYKIKKFGGNINIAWAGRVITYRMVHHRGDEKLG